MYQVHVLLLTDHHEENLVVLFDHDVSMEEVEDLLGRGRFILLQLWRLVVDRLIEVIHAEQREGHLLFILDVLLGQEVLICEELILILVGCLLKLVIIVEVLGENDVKSAVIVVVLHQLVTLDHLLCEVGEVVLEELQV